MGTGKDAGYSEEKALRTLAEAEHALIFNRSAALDLSFIEG